MLLNDLCIFKTGSAHGAEQLCFQQASGNSTRPQ
jgi:hypothetical protein